VSPFRWASRVYWEDTDGGGIVYYANYLRFLERARTEWLRSLGFSQRALAQEPGIVFTVVSLNIEYRRPAKLDDELVITCEPEAEGAATIRFVQRIYRRRIYCDNSDAPMNDQPPADRPPDQLIVEASVRVCCVDARTLRPKRLPEFLANSAPRAANTEEPS
jgi:acyl-CoA thioester hydrolase